jgi:hypothetical protein
MMLRITVKAYISLCFSLYVPVLTQLKNDYVALLVSQIQ